MMLRILKWTVLVIVSLWLLLVLFISFFSFNFMRDPISRMTKETTGRELKINGDLRLRWAWPIPHIVADDVTFSNPGWAKSPYMFTTRSAEVTLDLSEAIKRVLVLIEVRLEQPEIFLEKSADGRKNWLLDIEQKDEKARAQVGRLIVDRGRISYLDPGDETEIQADVSTRNAQDKNAKDANVQFEAKGRYKGLPATARGGGGPVLSLRDETHPYPLNIDVAIGRTSARAEGSITSLVQFKEVDLAIALKGSNLADLFPVIGIALPDTPPYSTSGHLLHKGETWRYEKFAGKIGNSDVAGTLQVDVGGKRPRLQGEVSSQLLDIADLGPLIGVKPAAGTKQGDKKEAATQEEGRKQVAAKDRGKGQNKDRAKGAGVLPDEPFRTDRWDTVDADVKIQAKKIRREKQLPLDNLVTHVKMQDSQLTLDPLNFVMAGGDIAAAIAMNGQKDPVQARLRLRAQKIQLGELVPAVENKKAAIARVDGNVELAGTGNSVKRILGTSNGKVGMVVPGGEISNLVMEVVGIDLWEILKFKTQGDQRVRIRCGVADFGVKDGIMQTNALVLDTDDTDVIGSGIIDLKNEQLDLTLNPLPKDTSPISLRTPIHIRGPLASPQVSPDKAKLTLRGGSALALAVVNPLLAVIPLIETGPGMDSDCGKLIAQAKQPAAKPEPPPAAPRKKQ